MCAYSEGPEGVKWELGFGQIFTGKWDFVTGYGNHRPKTKRTGTGILKIWEDNRLGNGI